MKLLAKYELGVGGHAERLQTTARLTPGTDLTYTSPAPDSPPNTPRAQVTAATASTTHR